MMTKPVAAAVAGLFLSTATMTAQRGDLPPTGDLIELVVVVNDRDGRPVSGLRQQDFAIKEDGRAVDVKTFDAVTVGGSSASSGRSVLLLLDDTGVPVAGTEAIQTIARGILSRAQPGDLVAVVRLNRQSDEPSGDLNAALARIDQYRAATVPFADTAAEDALKLVADLSRKLAAASTSRKAIVCIGSPAICNIAGPERRAPRRLYPNWIDAISATARAKVSVYAVVPGRVQLLSISLDVEGRGLRVLWRRSR